MRASAPDLPPSSWWVRLRDDVRAMVREQLEYRELLLTLTRRDLIVRYRQAVMGVGWAVFMPVLNLLVFSLIFTRVVPLDTGLPYPVYAYAGLLPWTMFASALRFSTVSLTGNAALVTKVYFPREAFPFSQVLVALVDFTVASLVLAGLMVYYRIGVTWTVALVPLVIVIQLAFTAGLALILAMANLFYRDVRHVFDVVVMVWMFATSVVYPVDRIGGRVGDVLALNPMTPVIDAYRALLLSGELPAAGPVAWASAVAVATLAGGWLAFHRAELRFAESI